MKPNRGLAATGAALNDHEPRRGLADQLELPWVDERRDLREMFVLAQLLVTDPELAGPMMRLRTHRRALPARKLCRHIGHPPPKVVA